MFISNVSLLHTKLNTYIIDIVIIRTAITNMLHSSCSSMNSCIYLFLIFKNESMFSKQTKNYWNQTQYLVIKVMIWTKKEGRVKKKDWVFLTRHRELQLGPKPAEALATHPGTRPQTSGYWHSTDPPWTQTICCRSDPTENSKETLFFIHQDSKRLTSVPVCQRPPLQHQTAASCSSVAA